MMHDVYFDESGDLGWIFDAPYRNGGSSRYFTIAYIIIPKEKSILLDRFIRNFYKSFSIEAKKEFKGMDFNDEFACISAKKIAKLLKNNSDIKLGSITTKKENVPEIVDNHSSNILYNYMVALGLTPKLKILNHVNIIPDKRSVPNGSLNSCPDLLKTKIWFDNNSPVKLFYTPEESHQNKRLMFIDWIANFIWRNYENDRSVAYEILRPHLKENLLYFNKKR